MFLTSRGQEHDVLEGFNSGAADYMVKPFSPRELQVRVRAVLAKR
jgi:DNA-binding response OmpR family regulator